MGKEQWKQASQVGTCHLIYEIRKKADSRRDTTQAINSFRETQQKMTEEFVWAYKVLRVKRWDS